MNKTSLLLLLPLLLVTACKKDNPNASKPAKNAIVSTIPITGNIQFDLGTGVDIAVDSAGNLFLADENIDGILKINPTGAASRFAGNGLDSNVNSTADNSSFKGPEGVAFDVAGNLYVADTWNNLIRKISVTGIVSTFAGSGARGDADGAANVASFSWPQALAIDAAGNVYVADYLLIRKISPAGVVSTLAGNTTGGNANGTGAAASFGWPTSLAVDAAGNIYVTDTGNELIRKISPAGVVTTFAGTGKTGYAIGPGIYASFNHPDGIGVDASGNVYVTDTWNNLIRKISPAGVVSNFAGNGKIGNTDGTGTSASFTYPQGIGVDKAGNVYVADRGNQEIRKIVVQ